MIAYHCDSNKILQYPFVNRKDKHIIRAYNSIMQNLVDRGHHVDIQILDNEVSAEFNKTIKKDWSATYQLVPPNVYRYGTNLSANYTRIIVVDSQFGQELEMSTS